MSSATLRIAFAVVLCVLLLAACCDAKRKKGKKTKATTLQAKKAGSPEGKQAELRETNPPNFVRLLLMRLIYGIATQMGLEERIAGVFNGAFAPPNADYDDFGVGDFGIDEGIGDIGEELF